MATVRITNGFLDKHSDSFTGVLLAGVITEGTITAGNMLLLEDGTEVPINAVEYIRHEQSQGNTLPLASTILM
jgi:hypothetical protein